VLGPTRDWTLEFPSVPPSPAPAPSNLRPFVVRVLLINYNVIHVPGGHALTIRENVHSRHICPGVYLAVLCATVIRRTQ